MTDTSQNTNTDITSETATSELPKTLNIEPKQNASENGVSGETKNADSSNFEKDVSKAEKKGTVCKGEPGEKVKTASPVDQKETLIDAKKDGNSATHINGTASPAEPHILQIDTTDTLDSYFDKGAKSADDINANDRKMVDANHKAVMPKEFPEMASTELLVHESKTDCELDVIGNENSENHEDIKEASKTAGKTEEVAKKGTIAEKKDAKDANKEKAAPPKVSTEGNSKDVKSEDALSKSHKTKDTPKCIWVSNVSRECKASDLKVHLSKFGRVTTAKIVTDGKLFYGYAIMEKPEEVNVCIKNLDGSYFEGKKIGVSNKAPESIKDTKEPSTKSSSDTKSISEKSSKDKSKAEVKRKPTPTLQNKSPKSRRNRSDMVREMELLKRRLVEEDRRREERRREERGREREREDRRRMELEFKLRDARKKLEQEREAFEREKIALIKLQKIVAEEERNKLKREKDNLKKEYKCLEAGLKRRKSADGRDYERKKLSRVEMNADRRKNISFKDDSWRFEDKMQPKPPGSRPPKTTEDYKYKRAYFSPKVGKISDEKMFCVAPPPPKLSEDFEYGRSVRESKGDIDNAGSYRKIDYMERPHRMEVLDRREERKPPYPEHREKKLVEKTVRYQSDYGDRVPAERKMPKYPSTIGGFPNGKPDFMEPKHYGKQETPRSAAPYPSGEFHGSGKSSNWAKSMGPPSGHSSMYVDHWKPEASMCSAQRYHGQQFPGSTYAMQTSTPEYYQQDGRYEYHGRKY